MTWDLLYRALYMLIHWLFTIYHWILEAVKEKGGVFIGASHGFDDFQTIHRLQKEIARKNKIPKHLTVLLGKEEPSYPDLANIVVWCIISQISFLSFYDYQGTLRKHQHKLEEAVSKKVSSQDHVIWHSSPGSLYKNGFTGRKIHIKIMSPENGKQSVVQLTRDLCKSQQTMDLTIESIDQKLQKNFEFPDPDLGLSCGMFLNLLHYPPWQIRVTEFLSIKSHHRIRYKAFLEQLSIFASCEQRLGT